MAELLSFEDFEEAYYHSNWLRCVAIAKALLKRKSDTTSKYLLSKLDDIGWAWDADEEVQKEFTKLLESIKVWLMLNN